MDEREDACGTTLGLSIEPYQPGADRIARSGQCMPALASTPGIGDVEFREPRRDGVERRCGLSILQSAASLQDARIVEALISERRPGRVYRDPFGPSHCSCPIRPQSSIHAWTSRMGMTWGGGFFGEAPTCSEDRCPKRNFLLALERLQATLFWYSEFVR